MINRILLAAAGSLGLLLLYGCGGGTGSSSVSTQNDLKAIGIGYHKFHGDKKRGPKDADELYPYVEKVDQPAAKALKEGNFVFVYGVGIDDMTPTAEYVLAYHKDVPDKGGAVLMGDATVKLVSASDFKNAKLAKAKS
jgi:hypothetical protein